MGKEKIVLLDTDITTLEVDAIVNAANNSLLGGGGVDGAIHRAAGPELLTECRTLNGCPTGEARITMGYNLKALYVIHTVGPIWQDGNRNEAKLLGQCYRNVYLLAAKHHIKTLALPAISTGVYGFPKKQAAIIAIQETRTAIEQNPGLEKIIFTCFNRESRKAYEEALQ